jgi:hypothetical protein
MLETDLIPVPIYKKKIYRKHNLLKATFSSFLGYPFKSQIRSKLRYANPFLNRSSNCYEFLNEGTKRCKMGSADMPESAARQRKVLVFLQRHAATFLPPH